MGKEKDKKPLFGGIFQKFFKPSAKAEAKKKKEHHLTVQRSIPYLEMGRDGICRVEEHLYSKTVRFYDINYQLAQNEDKNTIFESWCDFLNYFDSSIRFQLSFINHKSDMSEYNKVIQIEPQHDQFDDVRMEYAQMLKQQLLPCRWCLPIPYYCVNSVRHGCYNSACTPEYSPCAQWR